MHEIETDGRHAIHLEPNYNRATSRSIIQLGFLVARDVLQTEHAIDIA
jgi:hypothetical protein